MGSTSCFISHISSSQALKISSFRIRRFLQELLECDSERTVDCRDSRRLPGSLGASIHHRSLVHGNPNTSTVLNPGQLRRFVALRGFTRMNISSPLLNARRVPPSQCRYPPLKGARPISSKTFRTALLVSRRPVVRSRYHLIAALQRLLSPGSPPPLM